MNEATVIGLAILALIGGIAFIIGWMAFSWDFCDKHKLSLIGFLGVYLAPYILIGLIFLCYGLVVQPIINQPKEESATTKEEPMKEFRTDDDRRLAEHMLRRSMRRLIKHYRNEDSIDRDVVELINAYENLNGKVENEDEDY